MIRALLLACLITSGEGEFDLDSVSAEAVRADLEFLACDDMRGRDTPSLELRLAARYLRARVERLGFQPGGDGGSFLHTYPLTTRTFDAASSVLKLSVGEESLALAFGPDYLIPSTADLVDHDVDAELVWCGAGNRGDYEGKAVEGRWAICRDEGVSALRLRRNAERAGAIGLVVMAPQDREPLDGKWQPKSELFKRFLASWPSDKVRKKKKRLPQVYLAQEASRRFEKLLSSTETPARLHSKRVITREIEAENVCALWPGSDPELSKEVIILSAHYDHVGAMGDSVYNGADDNASGTSTLLAVADALAKRGPLKRSVLIIWVSGEEKGLWGSKAWAERPSLPADYRAICDLNMDMLGRNAPDELYITPSSAHEAYNGLVQRFENLASLEGFPSLGSADSFYKRSDHYEFAKLGIPVAFLFAGEHVDYHKPTDTADKIDTDKIRRVARLILRLLEELQEPDLDLQEPQ